MEQVAFADVILLNKADLVSEDDQKRITARIKVFPLRLPSTLDKLGAVAVVQLLPVQM